MIPVGVVAGSGQGTFPSAVTSSATQTSYNSITLSWTAPFNGGAPITSYSYQVSTDNSTWGTAVNAGLVTSVVVGSLGSPGTTYYFRVLATNSIGSGPYGASCNAATAKANTSIANSAMTANFTNRSGGGYSVFTAYGSDSYPFSDGGSIYGGTFSAQTGPYNYIVYCLGLSNTSAGGALSGKTVNLYVAASGYSDAYLGSATTDGSGNASLSLSTSAIAEYLISALNAAPDALYYWTFSGDSQFNGSTQTTNRVDVGWFDWNS
jgi:hypothetical protein